MRAMIFSLFLGIAAASPAMAQSPDLYTRVNARLSADPALAARLGRPADEMRAVADLAGTWDVTAEVESMPDRPPDRGTSVITPLFGGLWLEIRDTYAAGTQDVTYLTYDPASARWTSISIDSLANANIAHAKAWMDNALVFEVDATVLGLPARLRQTMTRKGTDEYTIRNEEWIDGGWKLLDGYRYVRRVAPTPAAH